MLKYAYVVLTKHLFFAIIVSNLINVLGMKMKATSSTGCPSAVHVNPGFMSKDYSGKPKSKRVSIESFDQVEGHANIFAGVIRQARVDSMPNRFFLKSSLEPIFSSFIPDAYDAIDFFLSGRANIYAQIQGLDAGEVFNLWNREWLEWKAAYAGPLYANLSNHVIKLLTSTSASVVHSDACAFYKGPQFKLFCDLAGVDVKKAINHIETSVREQSISLHIKVAAKA